MFYLSNRMIIFACAWTPLFKLEWITYILIDRQLCKLQGMRNRRPLRSWTRDCWWPRSGFPFSGLTLIFEPIAQDFTRWGYPLCHFDLSIQCYTASGSLFLASLFCSQILLLLNYYCIGSCLGTTRPCTTPDSQSLTPPALKAAQEAEPRQSWLNTAVA